MGHLITQTILSSYKWMLTAPNSWKERATNDFILKLRREDKFNPTPEVQRGINFERLICERCNIMDEENFIRSIITQMEDSLLNVGDAYMEQLRNLLKVFYYKCKGGEQQVELVKDIVIEGETFTLFGYADVLFPDKILDIKTCTDFRESKYSGSIQHTIYQYCSGLKQFQYIVADFKKSLLPQEFHIVDATCSDLNTVEQVLSMRLTEFVHYLKANGMWDTYLQKFCRGR